MDAAIEYFCDRPEHTEHKQNAHKRWQVGNGLEDRHENETTDTKEEDSLTLAGRQKVTIIVNNRFLCKREGALQREREDIGRDDHRHHRRDEDLHDDTSCGDDTLVPKHDGGDIADG